MSGNVQEFEVECNLRMSLYEGANLSGDVFAYFGGGIEVIGTAIGTTSGRGGDPVEVFFEADQSKWVHDTEYVKSSGTFKAESAYKKIGNATALGNGYSLRDMPMSPWKIKKGGSLATGMSHYGYDSVYWSNLPGQRVRVGVRFRGYANTGTCSPRNLHAVYHAAATNANFAGAAQVRLQESAALAQP